MTVSLKKTLAAIALTLALLASTFGLATRIEAAMPQHLANVVTSHQMARVIYPVCPPPPYDC